jgi:hypothetical protein
VAHDAGANESYLAHVVFLGVSLSGFDHHNASGGLKPDDFGV